MSLESFPTLKDFSDKISDDNNKCDFFILHNRMYQHLEDMYNSVDQYFPSDHCIMLQNLVTLCPFKVQGSLMDFSTAKY